MSSANDPIYWAPPDVRGTVVRMAEMGVALLHVCPTAVLVAPTTREQLDPMALGICRYCQAPLPPSPTEGHA